MNSDHRVNVFDVASKKIIKMFEETGVNCGLVISPDFSLAVGGKRTERTVYRLPGVKKLYTFKGTKGKQAESIVFSSDSKQILVAGWGPGVQLLDAASGKVLKKMEFAKGESHTPQAGFIGDGARFFVILHSEQIAVYETATFKKLHSFFVNDLPFQAGKCLFSTSDGKFGLVNDSDERVEVFSWETGKSIRNDLIGKKKYSSFAADLPHSRLYYGCPDGTIEVVQTTDWKCSQKIEGTGVKFNRLYVSPDGKRLAAQHLDGVEIYDTQSLKRLATLPIPTPKTEMATFQAVHFSPNWRFAIKKSESELLVFDLP